jgi:hypothetical protein
VSGNEFIKPGSSTFATEESAFCKAYTKRSSLGELIIDKRIICLEPVSIHAQVY